MEAGLTLGAMLGPHLEKQPGATAFVEDGRHITYGEFDRLARQAAAWLEAQGIRPGDRVAVWLVNRIEWLALLFGLARIGATLVAINTRYRATEVGDIVERSGARMLVLEPDFRAIDFSAILANVDPGKLAAVERIAVVRGGASSPTRLLGKQAVAFDAFDNHAPSELDHSDPEAVAVLFTTSGTTKGPKLVMHPQRSLAYHARAVAGTFGFEEPGARLLAALPFCGAFGLCSMLPALVAGAPAFLLDTFEAKAAVNLVRRHAITHIFGSDESFRRMLEEVPDLVPFPSVRVAGYAAFYPGSADLARAAWRRGLCLAGLYGSSEVQALFAKQPVSLPLEQCIACGGRPAAGDAAQVRVRDVEGGDLLPPGQSGEIEIHAPSNFVGYLGNPEATAAATTPDGFFRSGDIGRLRGDGTFVYETRRGDAMRLAGFLVSPFEIEDILKTIPGVGDAQVVAVDVAGQPRCVAFVIRAPRSTRGEAEIIAAAGPLMAGFKVPARVWFVEEFPVTQSANGTKIQRGKLRDMAMERLRASDAA